MPAFLPAPRSGTPPTPVDTGPVHLHPQVLTEGWLHRKTWSPAMQKTSNLGLLSAVWLTLGSLATPGLAAQDPVRPNIVFILMDDLRWDDIGCAGQPFVQTPNIDRLAKEGIRFRNAFATTPLCSPSRASFLTGLYPHTHQVRDNTNHDAISHRLTTFLLLLNRVGYATAFLGKWHMGTDDSPRPGIDHWVSFKGQGQYFDPEMNV